MALRRLDRSIGNLACDPAAAARTRLETGDEALVETVVLPVFVPGALLYVGDVHATMGDDKLSCGGVEIAAVFGLAVDVVRGVHLAQPRFSLSDRIVTTGWSRDFAQARRMAVSDMLDVLMAGLGIASAEALMLISVAGDLRIGQACGTMEMTLRLEMPKLGGLTAIPPSRT